MTHEDPAAILDAMIPASVRTVCARLQSGGHEAFVVGGAVRDALLGRDVGDWDVATSAHPSEVAGLFDHTIPTGIDHGTMTVVIGRGHGRAVVEVTTFRGEGEYSDSRRPDTVTFGVPLRDDLARRDFVVNAIAYDPISHHVADPFGGQADLAARRLRAVGDPAARFGEDGLRVMRAVRFAATLEFSVDPATEAAIPGALEALARVSVERVRVELLKLLSAARPSLGLAIAWRTGVVGVILPAAGRDDARWQRAMRAVDAVDADAVVRLAALLPHDLAPDAVEAVGRGLTLSNDERTRLVHLARHRDTSPAGPTAGDTRRWLATVGRHAVDDVLALRRAERAVAGDTAGADAATALAAAVDAVRDDPIAIGELAIGGRDVMDALSVAPGRHIGRVLSALLERVLDDPLLNTRDALVPMAAEVFAALAD